MTTHVFSSDLALVSWYLFGLLVFFNVFGDLQGQAKETEVKRLAIVEICFHRRWTSL